MDSLREKRVELILQQLEELPTLPVVAVKVLEATVSESTSVADVVALISSDQSLTARVLQLARRAGSGIPVDVTTIDRAIVLLGFDAVRCMVLAVSVFQAISQIPNKQKTHFSREEFWKHSIAVACCAELLAEQFAEKHKNNSTLLAEARASEALVCGLLHDLGKVALDATLPKSFDRVVEASELLRGNIADLERSIIGLDHMVVGKRLAERWALPLAVQECAWLHGQLPSALPAPVKNPRLVNIVTLSDLLVREQHLGFSGNYAFPVPRAALLDAIGLTENEIQDVVHRLVTRIEPRAQALGLGQASSSELYLDALTRANRELSRVSGQLVAKNQRLASRAHFFDALSQFQSELRPDAAPAKVLDAIGQTAIGVINVTSAAVFSVIPGKTFAETLLFDQHGDVFESTLIDCPPTIEKPPGGEGPVLAAGAELEWILSAISPRLAEDKRYWISLEADGQCIGGVVWGAKTGEGQRLSTQTQELSALAVGWALALRTAQIRDESRALAEQLAETNRRLNEAQEQIQRTKTIITVGEMAAGAAHEMNNPLAVISGRSQLLASQLTDPKQRHAAQLIVEQAHSLSEIITELMDFAKPMPPQCMEADLSEIVERALHEAKFTSDPVDRSIEVTIADIPPVRVDPRQVTAALIEVISNAIQATNPSSGSITIHAAADPSAAAASSRVAIVIADNGCGMDEETLRRAFDPFFSFKSAGRRRGMGLAKALRWIESSGGAMRLESRSGQGTRSIILLPASPGVESRQGTQNQAPQTQALARRAIAR